MNYNLKNISRIIIQLLQIAFIIGVIFIQITKIYIEINFTRRIILAILKMIKNSIRGRQTTARDAVSSKEKKAKPLIQYSI